MDTVNRIAATMGMLLAAGAFASPYIFIAVGYARMF